MARIRGCLTNDIYQSGPPTRLRRPGSILQHARHLITAWRNDYNHHRTHSSLNGFTPREYHQRSEEDHTLNSANL